MSLLVWMVTYFGLYFGVVGPAFNPQGFAEVGMAIIVCFVAAEFVQGFFEVIKDGS